MKYRIIEKISDSEVTYRLEKKDWLFWWVVHTYPIPTYEKALERLEYMKKEDRLNKKKEKIVYEETI